MKIVNAISLGEDLDMLEGRLHTYNDEVDYFVIVEGDRMYANQPKPYYFDENKDRFAQFMHKIVHKKITSLNSEDAYKNDSHQRSQLTELVHTLGLDDNDIVAVVDVDEWYPLNRIHRITETVGFDLNKMHMSLHWFHKQERNGIAGPWHELKNIDLGDAHMNRFAYPGIIGGWHLTSMGDADYLIRKVRGFAHHKELVFDGVDDALRECWIHGKDLAGDIFHEIELEQARYPQWIMERRAPEIWYRRRPSS